MSKTITFNGMSGLSAELGDEPTETTITVTNNGLYPVLEPMTGEHLAIGETVLQVTGAFAAIGIMANLDQLKLVRPNLNYTTETTPAE